MKQYAPVLVENYKWEGQWLFFRITTRCGECDTNTAFLKDMQKKEFQGKPVTVKIHPWLNHWFRCLLRGGWHAPIIFVNGKLFSQGKLISRRALAEAVEKDLLAAPQ